MPVTNKETKKQNMFLIQKGNKQTTTESKQRIKEQKRTC